MIGNKRTALEVLHGTLTFKRHRTWQPTHEVLMRKYLDICVELQQSRMAKDGIHQYRNLSQQQSPESLENVIKYLIDAAESKARDARARADRLSLAAASKVDDLEAEQVLDFDFMCAVFFALIAFLASRLFVREQLLFVRFRHITNGCHCWTDP